MEDTAPSLGKARFGVSLRFFELVNSDPEEYCNEPPQERFSKLPMNTHNKPSSNGLVLQNDLNRLKDILLGNSEHTNQVDQEFLGRCLDLLSAEKERLQKLSEDTGFNSAAKEARLSALIDSSLSGLPGYTVPFEILGRLWATAFKSLNENEKEQCYSEMIDGHNFFRVIDCLSGFLISSDSTPEELSIGLPKIRGRLGENGYNTGFWDGLQNFAKIHPSKSLKLLDIWKRTDSHNSPLPPDYWRAALFPTKTEVLK